MTSEQVGGSQVGGEGAPRLLLVVDDDPAVRNLLAAALSTARGYQAYCAADAMQARELMEAHDYAFRCAIIDIMMPEISGEEFLEWAKAVAPGMAAVMITGNRDDKVMIRCLGKGAIDFLEKPFRIETILEVVDRAVRRQERFNEQSGDIRVELPAENWVELTATSEMEYLSRVQRFTDLLFASHLPPEVCEDLRLAIEETGRNAIEWGNRFDREKMFHLSYCLFPDRIVLKIEDEGEGFKPRELRDPTIDPHAHIKQRTQEGKRPGGFGVYMLQKIMDEVVYSEKGNKVLMTKRLPR